MIGFVAYWLILLSLWGGPHCVLTGCHRFRGDPDGWGYAGPGVYWRCELCGRQLRVDGLTSPGP